MSGLRAKRPAFKRNKSKGVKDRAATVYHDLVKENAKFELYYKAQNIIPEADWDQFMSVCRSPLPTTFRFTGSRSYAKVLSDLMEERLFPAMKNIIVDDVEVNLPEPLPWYPGGLGWHYDIGRNAFKKADAFKKFHTFLHAETEVGNISRQEAVSMIPPLLLDVKPHHRVLDMCAAPGSKTAQIIEAVHADDNGIDIPDGLILANDADSKRAYMLVHQTKRLQSPCLVITNHDAQHFPNIDIYDEGMLKFDRVLADVPCSGDGTIRKNHMLWKNWTPSIAAGLHLMQTRILMRGIQMLKVGGQLVYSTCSLNPIENEAVIASALRRCDGAVKLVNVQNELPELKRVPGLTSWKVSTKNGCMYDKYADVPIHDLKRITPAFFAPDKEAGFNLDLCLRIYPHLQNTGGFFVAVFCKVSELDSNSMMLPTEPTSEEQSEPTVLKRSKDAAVSPIINQENDSKRFRIDDSEGELAKVLTNENPRSTLDDGKEDYTADMPETVSQHKLEGHRNIRSHENPFLFLNSEDEEVKKISAFYGIQDGFPIDQLMVRSDADKHQTIYLASSTAKRVLLAKNSFRLRIINTGVKLLSRSHDPNALMTCQHRFNGEGLPLAAPLLKKDRIVDLDIATLRLLLEEELPKIERFEDLMQQRFKELSHGCIVGRFDPAQFDVPGIKTVQWLSIWRAKTSLNLLVNKQERVSLMTRLGIEIPIRWSLEKQATNKSVNEQSIDSTESKTTISTDNDAILI